MPFFFKRRDGVAKKLYGRTLKAGHTAILLCVEESPHCLSLIRREYATVIERLPRSPRLTTELVPRNRPVSRNLIEEWQDNRTLERSSVLTGPACERLSLRGL